MLPAAIACACAGFLLAILWMDLIFDVQALRASIDEPALDSIAAYYRRATTSSRPMGHLIAVVMLALLAALGVEIVDGRWRELALASLMIGGVPILLALGRIVPRAVRLGRRVDPAEVQRALARAIARDHLLCFACIATLLALQLVLFSS
jgi:hypothetical protein